MSSKGFLERLRSGEPILVAEGYMWEFSRRGYLSRGSYVPEVVLEHPDLVQAMHREFVHAGSDVVLAFTYSAHRERMKKIGRDDELELLNRRALHLAKEVARETETLFAGGLSETRKYEEGNPTAIKICEDMFKEMIEWSVEAGVDYIVGETFDELGEALFALNCIKKYGKGVPAVITLAPYVPDETTDGVAIPEACRRLEEAGAAVVGLNCSRGPRTMMPLLKEIKKVCKGPVAALPVTFRCTEACRTFYTLKDNETGKPLYPNNLESSRCNSEDITQFGKEARELGIEYIGLCCGNCAGYTRDLAESFGRKPPASRYTTNMSFSAVFGDGTNDPDSKAQRIRRYMVLVAKLLSVLTTSREVVGWNSARDNIAEKSICFEACQTRL